ncbi:MAG: YceH family protein [Panacagrimonas sp.]
MAITLSPIEARVVASLVEKSITTPHYYPLSVNALVAACNQKSSRDPLMNLAEGDVGATLNRLEELRLVKREDQISRVPKWRHRFHHELLIKEPAMAVLATLMLRGPQTLSELRANAAPLNGPADVSGVQAVLEDLADRAQPLVAPLARQTGQSAQRHTQLICPEAAASLQTAPMEAAEIRSADPRMPGLADRVAALEARVAELEAKLAPLLS